MILRSTTLVAAVAGWALLAAGIGAAQETSLQVHPKLPAGAVLVGPLTIHGEDVAGLTLATAAAAEIPQEPGVRVPVQWAGPQPEGFAADLRAEVQARPGGLFTGAQVLIDMDLTSTTERPLLIRGRVLDATGSNPGYRTSFSLVSPRVASAEEFLDYIGEPAMKPLDTVLRCVEPDGGEWTLTFPVRGAASATTPDGRVLVHQNMSTMTSVSIVNGGTTRTSRFKHSFGEESPVRLEVIASGEDACASADGGSGSSASSLDGALLNCLGVATLPVEIHHGEAPATRDMFADAPTPTDTCTLSLVQSGFDRPQR